MARPSIVPIALTLDDRTGYTLWAPPWEEDGEEWQAFLGTTEDDTARVHLFPTPAALAAFCRTATDHDLADHPVWPVVTGLGAADLTPDDDHRYDLDGVYDIAAENPDRWAVEELAATIDIVSRLAECLDTSDEDELDEQLDEDLDGRRRGPRRRPGRGARPPAGGDRHPRRRVLRPGGAGRPARGRLAGPRGRRLRGPGRRGRLGRHGLGARRPLGGRRRGADRPPGLDRRRHGADRGLPLGRRVRRGRRRAGGRRRRGRRRHRRRPGSAGRDRRDGVRRCGHRRVRPRGRRGDQHDQRRQPHLRDRRRRWPPRRGSGRASASCRWSWSCPRAPV